jgi:hypothetical protein
MNDARRDKPPEVAVVTGVSGGIGREVSLRLARRRRVIPGYYCRSVGGYYPGVQTCPEGWVPIR